MYLSRVEIDDKNRRKFKKLCHLGAYHNWIEHSFPNEFNENKRLRHLWRIDYLRNKRYLLLLSSEKPDIANFEKYGVAGTAQIKNYDHYLNSLENNQIMRFRLTANPVSRHNGKVIKGPMPRDKKNNKNMLERQKDWLIRRMENSGFQIIKNDLDNYDFEIVNHADLPLCHKKQKKVLLHQVTYEGILEITDLEKFKRALTKGIGREKAYGMGLITVIPMN